MKEELQKAGLQKVIDEKQRQLDEWLKTSNRKTKSVAFRATDLVSKDNILILIAISFSSKIYSWNT